MSALPPALRAGLLAATVLLACQATPDGPGVASTAPGTLQEGLIDVRREDGALHMTLPADLLGAPLGLAVAQVTATGDFAVRGSGLETHLVHWDRVGDHLILSKENLDFRADPDDTVHGAVQSTFPDSPVFTAPLRDPGDDELTFDAGELFGPGLATLLPPESGMTVESPVLEHLAVGDDAVVARVRYRLTPSGRGSAGTGDGPQDIPWWRWQTPRRLPDSRAASYTVDYRLFRLPEDGYVPREADERVGGMTLSYKDFTGADARDTLFRHLLLRFDVRKADPTAEVSPPVEPITFVMDPAIPEPWRPLVREATLWWNDAFLEVGIADAIVVLDPEEVPDLDLATTRHSVIYWNLSDDLVFSGMAGPYHSDPRTGETLKALVHLNGEFFSFALNRYLVYAWWRAPEPGRAAEQLEARRQVARARRELGLCDRAASFSSQIAFARLVLQARGLLEPGTDEAQRFAREAFKELVVHEVGHALGFPHNWMASGIASWEDVRDGRVSGAGEDIFSASVMDYDPIYLSRRGEAQGDYFMQEVGPYDRLWVDYIYRPLEHLDEAERRAELDRIAARAEADPRLLFDDGTLGSTDPRVNADDLGDDTLAFAADRLTILRTEVLPRLPELVAAEGHDESLVRQALDSAVFSVAMDYIDMTARHVGGQWLSKRRTTSPASPADSAPPVRPVPAADQRRALAILDEHLFAEDAFTFDPAFLATLKADMLYDWNYPWRYASDYSVGHRIAGLYDAALTLLLEPDRLARVLDNERRVPEGQALTLVELLEHLRDTAFLDVLTSLPAGAPSMEGLDPGPERRALQRLLVTHLVQLTEGVRGAPAEAGQLAAGHLAVIMDTASRAAEQAPAGYGPAHFADLARRAERALDPRDR